jgi:hypothetical protein
MLPSEPGNDCCLCPHLLLRAPLSPLLHHSHRPLQPYFRAPSSTALFSSRSSLYTCATLLTTPCHESRLLIRAATQHQRAPLSHAPRQTSPASSPSTEQPPHSLSQLEHTTPHFVDVLSLLTHPVNMSSKLDTSLDDILKTRRQTKTRGRGGRRSDVARPAPSGPVGGVGKSTRPAKQPKSAPSGSAIPETTGKILVSGLVSSPPRPTTSYPTNA